VGRKAMEAAMRTLEKAFAFISTLFNSLGEPLVLAAAGFFFIVGLLVFYKKGPWFGIPISLAGVLLIVMAILRELSAF
jgi:hypothetical protein